eukprot:Amastigsp_a514900_15.p3 type:complete len:112 gc:universal Amastigsp_a514900_15:663-998(+)
MQDAMRIESVARLDDVKAEREPVRRRSRSHPIDHLRGLARRHPVLARKATRVGALTHIDDGRERAVELERFPHDLNFASVLELSKSLEQSHATNAAPRASNVRPNGNGEHD